METPLESRLNLACYWDLRCILLTALLKAWGVGVGGRNPYSQGWAGGGPESPSSRSQRLLRAADCEVQIVLDTGVYSEAVGRSPWAGRGLCSSNDFSPSCGSGVRSTPWSSICRFLLDKPVHMDMRRWEGTVDYSMVRMDPWKIKERREKAEMKPLISYLPHFSAKINSLPLSSLLGHFCVLTVCTGFCLRCDIPHWQTFSSCQWDGGQHFCLLSAEWVEAWGMGGLNDMSRSRQDLGRG